MKLEEHLRQNWNTYFPLRGEPRNVFFTIVKSNKKNMVFVFEEDSIFPVCVVKIANHLTGKKLSNNFFALKKLEDLNLPILKDVYPQPYFFGQIDNCEAMIQDFIKGQRMGKFVKSIKNPFWKISFTSNFFLINNWLMEFHKQTKQNVKPINKTNFTQLLYPIKNKLRNHQEIMNNLSFFLRDVEGKLLFNVFQHGDLHIDNIIIKKEQAISLIDWDLSIVEGLPLWDLLNFSIFYTRITISGNTRSGLLNYLNATFIDNNNISKIVAAVLSKYIKYLGMDPQVAKFIFLLWLCNEFNDFQMLKYAFTNCERFPLFIKLLQQE